MEGRTTSDMQLGVSGGLTCCLVLDRTVAPLYLCPLPCPSYGSAQIWLLCNGRNTRTFHLCMAWMLGFFMISIICDKASKFTAGCLEHLCKIPHINICNSSKRLFVGHSLTRVCHWNTALQARSCVMNRTLCLKLMEASQPDDGGLHLVRPHLFH